MTTPFSEFAHWRGVWTGSGDAQNGMPVLVRMSVSAELEETGLGFHFEAFDPGVEILYHGVYAVLCAAPNAAQRALVYSTIHGVMLLERTPDDEGVVALSGESATGNLISVTMVEESPDEMLFTGSWRRPDQKLTDDDAPRMAVPMKRIRAFKPPTP